MVANETTAAVPNLNKNDVRLIGNKNSQWYSPKAAHFPSLARELLENYSHIPPESVESHVLEVRDRAWEVRPYPCIGMIRFLELFLCYSPSYPIIMERLQTGASLLDIGCCFAQDLRKLVYDGAPSANLYGAELEGEFLELGYELFLDRDTFQGKFFATDIFDLDGPLKELEGKMDMVHIGMFLHLFDWNSQVKACERIVALTKSGEGALVVGRQIGHLEARETSETWFDTTHRLFRHNVESFEKMWEEVGKKTGSLWNVRANDGGKFLEKPPMLQDGMHSRQWLTFEVERLR